MGNALKYKIDNVKQKLDLAEKDYKMSCNQPWAWAWIIQAKKKYLKLKDEYDKLINKTKVSNRMIHGQFETNEYTSLEYPDITLTITEEKHDDNIIGYRYCVFAENHLIQAGMIPGNKSLSEEDKLELLASAVNLIEARLHE